MRTRIVLGAVCASLVWAAPAAADEANCSQSLERSYSGHYYAVASKLGKRAPGRNIRKYGVQSNNSVRNARCGELARSLRTFKRWLAPPVAPAMPADRSSANAAPRNAGGAYAIPRNIVMCESGGDYGAVNGSNPNRPAGAYQIITSTWHAYGGGRFAPTADAATPAEQDQVAAIIWAGGSGRGHWAC